MAEPNQPSNRKQRRAAARNDAKNNGSKFNSTTELDQEGVEYLLAHPDRFRTERKDALSARRRTASGAK